MEKHGLRKIALHIVVALILSVVAWFVYETTNVSDDRLDIRMSAQADGIVEGNIWWDERQRPYEDGWPLNLTSLQFEEIQDVEIEIKPVSQGSVNEQAQHNQVVVFDIVTDVVPQLDWDNTEYTADWQQNSNPNTPSGYALITSAPTAGSSFKYKTSAKNWIHIAFLRCSSCEGAQVTINDQTQVIDLYRDESRESDIIYIFANTISYNPDNIGLLQLPIVQSEKDFFINFGSEVNLVRFHSVDRIGENNWNWKPGDPLTLGEGTEISRENREYIEFVSTPGNNIEVFFNPPQHIPHYLPNLLGLLQITLIFLSLLIIITFFNRILQYLMLGIQRIAAILDSPPLPVKIGNITWFILGLAILFRVRYALEDPIILFPGDSGYYLQTALWIKQGFSYPLVLDQFDLRGPGYPAFLSVVLFVLGTSYTSIIIAQIGLGILTVIGAIRFGELIGSHWISISLGLFTAISPDHLFYEHVVMTEVLSITLVIWCSVFGLKLAQNPYNYTNTILFSLCSALAIYNRPNVILIVFFWLFLSIIRIVSQKKPEKSLFDKKYLLHCLIAPVLITLLVTPWIIRNGQEYDQYSMLAASNRGRMLFWVVAERTNPSFPRIAQLNHTYNTVDQWDWVYYIGNTRKESEIITEHLMKEQIDNLPLQYRERVTYAINNLVGITSGGRLEHHPRPDVRFTEHRSYQPGRYDIKAGQEQLLFTEYGSYGPAMRILNWSWQTIFNPARVVLSFIAILFIVGSASWFIRRTFGSQFSVNKTYDYVSLLLLGLGLTWVVTITALAFNLGYLTRYILPFDWIRIAVLVWVCQIVWESLSLHRRGSAPLRINSHLKKIFSSEESKT